MVVGGGGKGTSRAGLPAAASSATVEAPLREMTSVAWAKRAGMSPMKAGLPAAKIGAADGVGCLGLLIVALAALVENGEAGNGLQ